MWHPIRAIHGQTEGGTVCSHRSGTLGGSLDQEIVGLEAIQKSRLANGDASRNELWDCVGEVGLKDFTIRSGVVRAPTFNGDSYG